MVGSGRDREVGTMATNGLVTENRLEVATVLVTVLHAGQTDAEGLPYVRHVQRVAERLVTMGNPDLEVAALLHDAVEDTPLTCEEVEALFGPRVARIVKTVTRLEGETYDDFIVRIGESGTREAIQVKLADLADNLDPKRTGSTPDMDQRYRVAVAYLRPLEPLPHPTDTILIW
jgi:(p)ppGpp synthase/HD superfamily hydrolase